MTEEVLEWKAIGTEPIRADAPAGESVRYDPDFEKLQTEIAKMEHAAGKSVNWKEVISVGQNILKTKSKDLFVASYVCLGLFEERGYLGLQAGLSLIDGMVTTYWDSLYPEAKRMRGRINSAYWLAEKGGESIPKRSPQSADKAVLEACVSLIQEVEKVLDEKIGQESPSFRPIRDAIAIHLRNLESPDPQPPVQKPAENRPSASLVPSPSPPATAMNSLEDAVRALREAGTMVRRASTFAIKQNPSLTWPYRMNRAAAWWTFENLPPAQGTKTMVPAPQANLAAQFEQMAGHDKWIELLDHTESQLSVTPLWLDLNRLSAKALEHLGDSNSRAVEAIKSETGALLARLPGLQTLEFSNGTPLADEETRRWLGGLQAPTSESPSDHSKTDAVPQAQADSPDPGMDRGQALKLMKKGKYREAISVILEEMNRSSSKRDHFLAKVELAKLCLEAGQPRAAVSQLEGLDREIERFGLEEWEPSICVQVFQLSYSSLKMLAQEGKQPSPDLQQKSQDVYKKLARIDLAAAFDLEGKKKGGWFGR